jgi:hypothetical protein
LAEGITADLQRAGKEVDWWSKIGIEPPNVARQHLVDQSRATIAQRYKPTRSELAETQQR